MENSNVQTTQKPTPQYRDPKPPNFSVFIEKDIPVITFNELVEGGMPAKWKVLLDVALEHLIQNELVTDKEI